MNENGIGTIIVNEAVRLHLEVGPGLLESVYEKVLAKRLIERGLEVRQQSPIAITINDMQFKEGFRADLIVEDKVIVELKSVQQLNAAHRKQLLTYLKMSDLRLGYLLNFGSSLMKDGIIRIINGSIPSTPK